MRPLSRPFARRRAPGSLLPRGGGRLHLPGRLRTFFLLAILCVAAVGCASAEKKVLTSANGWAWANARYEERCVEVAAAGCASAHGALAGWRKRLEEAVEALERKGALPRQLQELRSAEKRAIRALPKEDGNVDDR